MSNTSAVINRRGKLSKLLPECRTQDDVTYLVERFFTKNPNPTATGFDLAVAKAERESGLKNRTVAVGKSRVRIREYARTYASKVEQDGCSVWDFSKKR